MLLDDIKGTIFGPPYTTGTIHQGNAAAIVIKDFYYRYLKLKGKDLYKEYPYAVDTQGLPIEQKVEKNFSSLNIKRKDIPVKNWVQECLNYSDKNIPALKNQLKHLRLLCDVEKTSWIKTNDIKYKTKQLNFFSFLYDNGFVYKDTKYINYCLNCDISLSNAELELSDIKKKKTYLLSVDLEDLDNTKLVFATTCPHTIINNVAIAIADKKYYTATDGVTTYVIGHPDLQALLPPGYAITGEIEARELIKIRYQISLFGKKYLRPIIIDDFVKYKDLKNETPVDLNKDLLNMVACVHLSPWDSAIDGKICLKHEILDKNAIYNSCFDKKEAKKVFKDQLILLQPFLIKTISVQNLDYELYTCWRCKNLVDQTLTLQWFIRIDAEKRAALTQQILKLKTNNAGFLNKFLKWCSVSDADWCISRTRHYGTPLPYVSCKNQSCDKKNVYQTVYFTQKDFKDRLDCYPHSLKTVLKEKAVTCNSCKRLLENDDFCLDVWTDSGFLPYYLSDTPEYEFLMEGQDQNRGFFYVVAVLGLLKDKKIPYKGLIYTPWFITEEKKKISKSEGAGSNFLNLLELTGVENFRSYCLSKCDGSPVVFNTNNVLLEKKYINVIKNLKKFLNQKEYLSEFKPLSHYEEYFKIKDPIFYQFISLVKDLEKRLHELFLAGNFSSYWIRLREFLLQNYSRDIINPNKIKARMDESYAAVIKYTGDVLLSLCDPVLGS